MFPSVKAEFECDLHTSHRNRDIWLDNLTDIFIPPLPTVKREIRYSFMHAETHAQHTNAEGMHYISKSALAFEISWREFHFQLLHSRDIRLPLLSLVLMGNTKTSQIYRPEGGGGLQLMSFLLSWDSHHIADHTV